jgi:NAD(P)-dependent dehydrogenase (short-subunit alcohol dehydrogenase family)
MANRIILVTGALTGIGRAIALAFAKQNDTVVVAGRHQDPGDALADDLLAAGAPESMFTLTDVRFDDQVAALIDAVVERFGRLDVAVNNAGTDGTLSTVPEITPEMYATVFDTNVLGTLLSTKHELRIMQPQGAGSIVNVSSIFGDRGAPRAALYVSSKHAVIGLTRSAALEAIDYGVRVNAVAPGYVDTEMFTRTVGGEEGRATAAKSIPAKRAGEPDEIAAAVTFIASEGASYLTGQTIFVDGGLTAG